MELWIIEESFPNDADIQRLYFKDKQSALDTLRLIRADYDQSIGCSLSLRRVEYMTPDEYKKENVSFSGL